MARRLKTRRISQRRLIPPKIMSVSIERRNRTVSKMNKNTGKMMGRKVVKDFRLSDKTGFVRLKNNFDVNNDGRITKVDYKKGQIIGRVPTNVVNRPKAWKVNKYVKTSTSGKRFLVSTHIKRRR